MEKNERNLCCSLTVDIVIQIASPKPVLVRGGGKASEEEIMQRTYQLMKQGAKGIVYLY